jgi:ankyrin repeat protein
MFLHFACDLGKTHAAIALIERGAKNVNEKARFGQTPLHWACISDNTARAVALIERGTKVNEKDVYGRTPLYYACYLGYSATAIALLKNGAVCVNDRDTRTLTPLYPPGSTTSYFACRKCTTDVVLRMIQIGAILTADDLQIFRDRSTGTEEQACTVEAAYNREVNWRRRTLCHVLVQHKERGGCGAVT